MHFLNDEKIYLQANHVLKLGCNFSKHSFFIVFNLLHQDSEFKFAFSVEMLNDIWTCKETKLTLPTMFKESCFVLFGFTIIGITYQITRLIKAYKNRF